MFTGMKATSQYAYAAGAHVEAKDTAHTDSLTGLMSRAFVVMFDGQARRDMERRQVEQRRDAEFDEFVSQHGPFSRYIP